MKNTTMNSKEVKTLLGKYYDGDSTLEDEELLKEYFSKTDIPKDLLIEKEIFRYYMVSSSVPEPSENFEERIISALDSVDKKSAGLKQRKIYGFLTGVAALLLILTGYYFFFVQRAQPRDTYSDPEIAYAETMKILNNVSVKLNHATKPLERIGSMQEVTKRTMETIVISTSGITERMKPLANLKKAMDQYDAGKETKK